MRRLCFLGREVPGGELVKKEERDAAERQKDGDQIGSCEPLFQKDCRQNQNKNRGGKLKDNRICSSGIFIGSDKTKEGQAGENPAYNRSPIDPHVHPAGAQINSHTSCRKQAARARDGQRVPRNQLDKNTRNTPERCADCHEQDCAPLYTFGCHIEKASLQKSEWGVGNCLSKNTGNLRDSSYPK